MKNIKAFFFFLGTLLLISMMFSCTRVKTKEQELIEVQREYITELESYVKTLEKSDSLNLVHVKQMNAQLDTLTDNYIALCRSYIKHYKNEHPKEFTKAFSRPVISK